MTLTKPGYRPRLVDDRVELMLRTFGAVCIEGPKYSGKTWTSLNHANSAAMLGSAEGNFETRRLAEIDPSLVLEGDRPHLVDEWQDVPAIWDAVRDRVDDSTEKGRFILTGSSTPKTKGIHHSGNGRIGDIRMDTMSLIEAGDSEGNVSLASLFDGTFRNVALFSGYYDVTPTEGPFFPAEAERVHLEGVTKHDFKVTPYLRINIEDIVYGEPGSAEVTVKYTIKRATTPEGMTIGKKTIAEARLLCNIYPVVCCYNGGFIENNSSTKILSRSTDASIESRVYEDQVKNLESGKTYYIRVAALSSCDYNSSLQRYNYTPVIEIVAP